MIKTTEKHWYHREIVTCPLCGKFVEYRERRAGIKPTEFDSLFQYREVYDWCDG